MKNIIDYFDFFSKYNDIENRTFYKKIDTNEYAWFAMDTKNAIEKELTLNLNATNFENCNTNHFLILDMKIDESNIENFCLKLKDIETEEIKDLNIQITKFTRQFQMGKEFIKYFISDSKNLCNYKFTFLKI